VVKLGKTFSIFVVLTLLILLAPAMMLAPVGNVAANGEEVVQEVEASFNFNETASGEWHVFTAGSAGNEAGYGTVAGLTLEQYTRPYVFLTPSPVTLPGCGFRNYTTGSGTVTGMDGPVSLMWNTFRFNQIYSGPGDLYYPSATDFGWISGRGHIGENLTFVFVADLDCDDTMTNGEGKGFMVSTEESGASAGHKVIGDFEIVKTGSNQIWSLHLRDYAPNEVYYRGNVTVFGGVMQELTDDIYNGVDIVNFTKDGPESTPTDFPTGFEEICWGKDPQKNVTGGPLGVNGTMDITRNGALYLTLPGGWAHIQAAMACILHIDDTYAVTGDDGSTYGHAYYYLVLTLPYQELIFGDFFNQTGYTWGPFGAYLQSTDLYSGMETFANAHIGIESSATDSLQTSVDESYGLYPHPKVSNNTVTPNKGAPGQTLDVTITGKYFLRAAGKKSGWVNNSGSVDFGDNITVNSYTINNATKWKDNSITASITIDGDAPAGTRNVSVTSCFGYANGSGAAPYKTGTLVDGFAIEAAGASLDGHVDLQGLPATDVTVRLFSSGTQSQAAKVYGTTDSSGNFTVSGLPSGTYDVAVKGQTGLSSMVTGVDLSVPGRRDFGTLVEGDANGDDYIDGSDFGPLSVGWHGYPGCTPPPTWNPDVDFTRDNYIDGSDFGKLSVNWHEYGDCIGWPGDWS